MDDKAEQLKSLCHCVAKVCLGDHNNALWDFFPPERSLVIVGILIYKYKISGILGAGHAQLLISGIVLKVMKPHARYFKSGRNLKDLKAQSTFRTDLFLQIPL